MNLRFDRDVFAYEALSPHRFRATVPHPVPLATNVSLSYAEGNPPVEGEVVGTETDISVDGFLAHIVVQSEDTAGVLAADATAHQD